MVAIIQVLQIFRGDCMRILNSAKFKTVGMTAADYRTGMIDLMILLEKHSEEFTTPEQLIMLIHEYSELLTTVYNLDIDSNTEDDDEGIDSEADDDDE